MKKLFLLLAMTAVTLTAGAQADSTRTERKAWTADGYYAVERAKQVKNPTADTHLAKAGKHLQLSAVTDGAAWAMAIASGVVLSGEVIKDDRAMSNAIGGALAVGAVVLKAVSIHKKWKSGAELRLEPGAARLTF